MKSLVNVSFKRSSGGRLEVTAKAHEMVENLMREMAHGEVNSSEFYGRSWRTIPLTEKGLGVYNIPTTPTIVNSTKANDYTLWMVGEPFHQPIDRTRGTANISFLRLVGLTKGVAFTSDEMLSRDAVNTIGQGVSAAINSFFNDFLKEHSVHITATMEA